MANFTKEYSTYKLGVDLLQVSNTQVTSIDGYLVLEDLNGLGNTFGTVDVGEHEGAAETDSLYTEGEKLQDISTVADTTVGVDLKLAEDLGSLLVDLKGNLESGRAVVELTATVVGENDGRGAVLDSELGILDAADTLKDDGEGSLLLELLVVVPLLNCQR